MLQSSNKGVIMTKRTLIWLGVVIGGIGTIGEILMLAAKVKGRSIGVLILWAAVLAVSLYFMQKDQKENRSNK